MNFAFLDAWHRFLPRSGGHLIVVRGGGGRSDLLRAVSRVLAAEGVPVAMADPGVTPAEIDQLGDSLPDHVVIYEAAATGAAALPRRASLVITVSGLSGLGRPPTGAATGEVPVPAHWLSRGDQDPVWSWDGIVAFLDSLAPRAESGEEPVPQVAALLEMDTCTDSIGLFGCVERIMTDLGIPLVLLGSAAGAEPYLQTAYVLTAGERP